MRNVNSVKYLANTSRKNLLVVLTVFSANTQFKEKVSLFVLLRM